MHKFLLALPLILASCHAVPALADDVAACPSGSVAVSTVLGPIAASGGDVKSYTGSEAQVLIAFLKAKYNINPERDYDQVDVVAPAGEDSETVNIGFALEGCGYQMVPNVPRAIWNELIKSAFGVQS